MVNLFSDMNRAVASHETVESSDRIGPTGVNLVFLLSAPRSGSTLLGAMLTNHPALYCPNEPWLLLNLYGLFDGKPQAMGSPNENLATAALRELISEKQFSHAARAFARSVYNQKLQQQGKQVFIDKTPRYYQVLSFLDELFPAAKKIWLKRNPLDVAVSYADTWQVPVAELAGESLSPNSLDLTIGLRNYTRYFRGQKNTFEVRYEDLVTNAPAALERLCAFLDVPYEPGLEDYHRGDPAFSAMKEQLMGDKNIFSHPRPHTQSVDKWKQRFTTEDLQRLVSVIGERTLTRMGYEHTVGELKARGCRFPADGEVEDALVALEQKARAMPGESGVVYHLLMRTKTDADKASRELEQLREEEAISLQRKNLALEAEVFTLRRDLRRARRNTGYRIVNGISRALEPFSRLIANGSARHIQFARPAGRNGSPSHPCSSELKSLLKRLRDLADSAFFTSATHRNWALHKFLGHKPERQLCFSAEQLRNAIRSDFFAVPEKAFAQHEGAPAFAHQTLVVIDCDEPGPLWPMLKGRLWPHQKLLLHGQGVVPEFSPAEHGSDFAFYPVPPPAWLDPRHAYLPIFAPWKTAQRCLSPTLPSGNAWPKISVVTPSFNQGQFITDTFESVLGQAYPTFEYLVLDGGSTDETRSILDRYRPRLAYACSQKDNGQADAINKGFARATGEIMAWLNSDDQYAPDALMHVARAFDQFPEADIVVGGCGLVEGSVGAPTRIHHSALPIGKIVPLPLAQLLDLENCWLKGDFFYQPEVFWRRAIWEAAGGHVVDDLYYCFDYDLWVRMAQRGAKVVHIPDLLALYRVHPQQKTYGNNLPYLPELKLVKSRRDPSATRNEPVAKA